MCVVILCVFVVLCGHCCCCFIIIIIIIIIIITTTTTTTTTTLNAGLLATGQYSEGPATGHLDTGFSWFPCA